MSTDRQRDAETDRLLRATLQPGVHAEACPGADIVAAYAEGSLSPTERDGVDVHFAECHRCQEALAFMARTWTDPDAAQPSAAGRWWSIRMRWLVPVAAAAVVVMYVAVRPVIAPYFPPVDPAFIPGPSPVPEHGMADAATRPSADSAKPPANAINEVRPGLPPPAASPPAPAPPVTVVPASPARAVPAPPPARAAEESPQQLALKASAPAPPAVAVPAPPPVMAAAAFQPEAVPASPPTPLPAAQRAAQRAEATDAPRQQMALESVNTAPREIRSPDGSVVWRIGPRGRLLRSTNRDTTWQTQPSGVSVELLAGSAPSATVCWIVGRDAMIIVTTGGAQWTTRPFPERVDLVAVEATDARSATVTTRDGRRFSTLDGGATWAAK